MRRKLFYLSVALMAFVTGTFFLYLFSFRTFVTDIAVQTEPTQELTAVSVLSKPSLHQEIGTDSLISDKEKALLLFEPTLNKWLRKENIAGVIEPSPEILQKIGATKLHRYEAPYLNRMAQKSYKPSLIDLNDDKLSELSILINCDEPDGCELWVFREMSGNFEVILRTSWKFEKFKITMSKSKGFRSIQTSHYYNEMESETSTRFDNYKFDGQNYYHSGCSEYVNRYRDNKGEIRYLKKPVLLHLDDCC